MKSTCDEALNCLKDNYNVSSKEVSQREFLPKITIYDISSEEYSNEKKDELKTAILNKNPTIKALVDDRKEFDVLFLLKDKGKSTSRAVVKLHPDILKAIQKSKYKIYIDFNLCRVSDRFFIKQCYRCQKFGHHSAECQLKTDDKHICRYCANNHKSVTCNFRQNRKSEHLKCSNCGGNHSTTDASCPILQRQVNAIMSRTKGMENHPKNLVRPHAIVT